MENGKRVACPENEELAAYLLNKRQEIAQSAKGISENLDLTLSKAYSNICNGKTPIKTLKELSQIKGVGKWILKQMQGFFETESAPSENDDLSNKGKKNKGRKRYVPQKNSVAYALLITLFRGTENDCEYMRKKDLIDAAETSGLSRVPIAPEKAKGKAGHFGSSPRDWYSGWSCMKTLIARGLVVKSSCPAKYMLTEEGKEVAQECLLRSGLVDPNKDSNGLAGFSNLNQGQHLDAVPNLERIKKSKIDLQGGSPVLDVSADVPVKKAVGSSPDLKNSKKPIHVPQEYLDKFVGMGFSHQQIIHAFSEVIETSKTNEISSIWPTVLCRLREDEIYGSSFVSNSTRNHCAAVSLNQNKYGMDAKKDAQPHPITSSSGQMPSVLCRFGKSCSTSNSSVCNKTEATRLAG